MYEGILSPLTLIFILFLFLIWFSNLFFQISRLLKTLTSFEKLGSKLCFAYNRIQTWSILNNSAFMIWWKHNFYFLNALIYIYIWSSFIIYATVEHLRSKKKKRMKHTAILLPPFQIFRGRYQCHSRLCEGMWWHSAFACTDKVSHSKPKVF
jgi:hypothetical protein